MLPDALRAEPFLPSTAAWQNMAGARIKTIEGIFNGTSNYILDRMEQEGISLQEALEDAVRSGIAEADPSLDIEGYDTAIKLLILAKNAHGG